MATEYRVYRGDASGGPVDYGTVVGTTASLTFATPALDLGSVNRFAVRAFDTVSGLEELNVDAVVTIRVDGAGVNVSALPNAPGDLIARAIAGGGARVDWTYNPGGQGGSPTSFKVWATPGGVINYAASPAATVTYSARSGAFSIDLTGLTDGVTYGIGVRATNATGDESNTLSVLIEADSAGPEPVDDFAGSVVSGA